jgi:hypothetical protein
MQTENLKTRTSKLLAKFTIVKSKHDLIERELATFKEKVYPTERKLLTIFDKMLNLTSRQGNQDTRPTSLAQSLYSANYHVNLIRHLHSIFVY